MRRLNAAKSDSHSRRSHVGDVSDSDEGGPVVVDTDAHLGSAWEGRGRLDKTAENAQIAGDAQNLPFRLDIHNFGLGRKGPPHGAMLFHPHNRSMNLFLGGLCQFGIVVSLFT